MFLTGMLMANLQPNTAGASLSAQRSTPDPCCWHRNRTCVRIQVRHGHRLLGLSNCLLVVQCMFLASRMVSERVICVREQPYRVFPHVSFTAV